MIVINSTELRTHQKKYFDLAEIERVVVKRGRKLIELKVISSISPSDDPYYDNLDNVYTLTDKIKHAKSDIENGETIKIRNPKDVWESIQ